MATHSSVLAWRISGTGHPGGLRLWGRTELDTTEVTQQQQQQHLRSMNPKEESSTLVVPLKLPETFSQC